MTLHDFLTELPLDDLKLIASTLELRPTLISRARLLRELPIQMLQPGFIESCVGTLNREEQDLLLAVTITSDRGYTCDISRLSNQKLSDPLYTLLSHGLIFGRRGQYHTPEYIVPTDIHDVLVRFYDRQIADRLIARERPPGVDETEFLSFIRDLFSFLSWLRLEPARLTEGGVIYKRAQDALFNRFESRDTYTSSSLSTYPDRLDLMIHYCQSRRLVYVEDSRLRCSFAFEQWQPLPATEKLDDLLAFWYSKNRGLSQRTSSLLGVLYLCLDLDGIDLDAMIQLVIDCTPGLSRESSALVQNRLGVLDALRELEWLGLLRQYGEREGTPSSLVITPFGRSVLGNRAWAEEGMWTEWFVVQPTYEVIVPRTLNLVIRDELERFADLIAVDRTLTYRITKDTVYRAGDDSMSGEAIITFLERHSEKQIPQNMEYSIREWGDSYGQVYFMDVFLLRTADAEIAQHIKAHNQLAPYIHGEVAPDALIVDRHQYREMMDLLRQLGFMPKLHVIGLDTERRDVVHHSFARERFADIWARHPAHRPPHPVIGVDECLPGFRLRRRLHSVDEDTSHLMQSTTMQHLSPKYTQELLEMAITHEQTVLIDYYSGNRSRSHLQKIRPQQIENSRGAPYVKAYRLWEDDIHAFKIAHIKAIRITDDTDKKS